MGGYASAGWSSSAGWNTSTGYSYGVQVGPFSVSVLSAGVSYSQNGGFSANAGWINYNQHSGFSMNPSVGVGYRHGFEISKAAAAQAAQVQAEAAQRRLQEALRKMEAILGANTFTCTPADLSRAVNEMYPGKLLDLDMTGYKRRELAASAYREVANESTQWMTDANGPKCSTFAHDMMVENRMNPTSTRLQAGIWSNRNSQISGWSVVTDGATMSGDIGAYGATPKALFAVAC